MTQEGRIYRIRSDTVVGGTVTADRFIGVVDGRMEEAVVAQKDYLAQVIDETYVKDISAPDGSTLLITKGDDTHLPPISLRTEPLPHDQSSATITELIGYVIAQEASPLTVTDTLNEALGKLEKGIEDKQASLSAEAPIEFVDDVISHADSGVTPTSGTGFYNKFTVDSKGHVTQGSKETTLQGIGITEDIFTAAGFTATIVDTDNL